MEFVSTFVIGLPFPEVPLVHVQLNVVPAWLDDRIMLGEVPEQIVYPVEAEVAIGAGSIVT